MRKNILAKRIKVKADLNPPPEAKEENQNKKKTKQMKMKTNNYQRMKTFTDVQTVSTYLLSVLKITKIKSQLIASKDTTQKCSSVNI